MPPPPATPGPSPAGQPGPRRLAGFAVLGLAVVVLLALHVMPWPAPSRELRWGWLPDLLAWRVAWMGLATVVVVAACRRVWTDPEEDAP